VPAKQLQCLKYLTLSDLEEYLSTYFQLWDEILIKQFKQFSKFNEIIA
jgi:hypothetical protein